MKIYEAIRHEERGVVATVRVGEDGPRDELFHHVQHSPTGFEMGYQGSGPADLARSICWDVLGREPHPVAYQAVKDQVVSQSRDAFAVTSDEVLRIMRAASSSGQEIARLCGPNGELMTWEETEALESGVSREMPR